MSSDCVDMPSLSSANHSSNSGMRLIVYIMIVISCSHFASVLETAVIQWGDLHLRTLKGWQVLQFTFESAPFCCSHLMIFSGLRG